MTITDASITGNTAAIGGGLYGPQHGDDPGRLHRLRQHSVYGGGLAAATGSMVTIDGSKVTGNTATSTGGGLYAADSTVMVEGSSTLSKNIAGTGGGLYADGARCDDRRLHHLREHGELRHRRLGSLHMRATAAR